MEVNLASKRAISERVICLKAVFVPSQSHFCTNCSSCLYHSITQHKLHGSALLRKILFQICDPMNALIEYGEFCEED